MILYQKWGVSPGAKATTRGFVIFIDPAFKDDPGLIPHEQVHVDQFFRTVGLHVFLYRLSKAYRFKSEVEAYREQLQHYPLAEYPQRLDDYAEYLVAHYGLGITKEQAINAIKGVGNE